jgi:hypothetical protein
VHTHRHPTRVRFTTPLALGSVTHHRELNVSRGVTRMAITVPRAPSPLWGVIPQGGACPATSTGVTRSSSLLRAHAPALLPLPAYALWRGPRVWAGCRVPLLGGGPARCDLPHRCGGAWTRTPPRFGSARTRFFPQNLGLPSRATSSAHWTSRHSRHFHDEPMSGLPSFREVQAPPRARPPGGASRRRSTSSGQPGRVRHAMPVWGPHTHGGLATCLTRAIDTAGRSPARLKPFRPLHASVCSAGETHDTFTPLPP